MPRSKVVPGRGRRAQRSAAEWGIRGTLAVAALVLGYAGVTRSAGYMMRTGDPVRAHALASGDGRVTGLYAQAVLGMKPPTADRASAARLAREALRQDPTAVAAVSTLGFVTQLRGDVAGARRLFAYGQLLSRRDLKTEIWAIEDAVGRGDIAEALRHYDAALRTSREAPGLLFPVLASAIADPPVRAALVGTLARQPAWGPHFIGYAASEGLELRATAELFAALRRAGVPVSDDADLRLIDRLIGNNLLDEAWSFYASAKGGMDRRRSRDPRFAGNPVTATAFDWRVVETPGLTVSIQRENGGGVVDFAAAPGIGGPVVQQMQVLPAGRYRLDGHATGIDQPEGSRPYWSLTCRDGRELARIAVSSPRQAGGAFAGEFVVPPGCPVQILSLVVRSSDMMTGVTGQIDQARLVPGR